MSKSRVAPLRLPGDFRGVVSALLRTPAPEGRPTGAAEAEAGASEKAGREETLDSYRRLPDEIDSADNPACSLLRRGYGPVFGPASDSSKPIAGLTQESNQDLDRDCDDLGWCCNGTTYSHVRPLTQRRRAGFGGADGRRKRTGVLGLQATAKSRATIHHVRCDGWEKYRRSRSPLLVSLLDGVVIEILTGPLAGRRTVTGGQPYAPPGFSTGEPSPGRYTIYGVPPGVHRLRASKTGFKTQETEVSFKSSTPQASFEMVPVS